MTRRIAHRTLAALAGLSCASVLWSASTGTGDLLSYPQCHSRLPVVGVGGLAAVLVSLIAGWSSWRTYTGLHRGPGRPQSDLRRALVLLAGIGAGASLLFGVALALQALAGFLLSGCER